MCSPPQNSAGDDFSGGEFHFLPPDQARASDCLFSTDRQIVRPQQGRVVAFSAGPENVHEVAEITKGKRYTLNIWFTLDPTHNEELRYLALLRSLAHPTNQNKDDVMD
eukprot:Colp12_sorted_trinity150504_noHs@295